MAATPVVETHKKAEVNEKAKAGLGTVPPLKAKIAAALAEDAACRHPGVTEGLYGLEQLAPFQRLDGTVPMISRLARIDPRRAADNAEFGRRLQAMAPFLATLEFQKLGLRLAGGAASAILMHDPQDLTYDIFRDYDLFLVGHKSYFEAKAAIAALGQHLASHWEGDIGVYRTQNCITFHTSSFSAQGMKRGREAIVQVILRRYSTNAEVVHGFDLGSSAVLWDGQKVVVTALGRIAVEHGANILNLVARRASYERRLARYFERGFDVVLPDLDGAALLHNAGRLPYLYLSGASSSCTCSCGGCSHIRAWGMTATRPGFGNLGTPLRDELLADPEALPESDYAFGEIWYGEPQKLLARNVWALAHNKPATLCAYSKYEPSLDFFKIEPYLDRSQFCKLVESYFKADGSIQVKSLKTALGSEIATRAVILVLAGESLDPDLLGGYCDQRLRTLFSHASIPFDFMTVEDKTALTGPFTREVVSARDWYGACYRGL